MNIRHTLDQRVRAAMIAAGAPEDAPAAIQPAGRPEFGDYQANGVMGAAKRLRSNPRTLAVEVLKHLDISDMAENVEIAGPGFINIRLDNRWIGQNLRRMLDDTRLGIARIPSPQKVVVDYSAPNLAKEMHVGHLRSTIIGDAVVRILEFLGHDVVRQNHVGDWGTQFGMLIAYMERTTEERGENLSIALSDLETFYRQAKQLFDSDEDFAAASRDYVVKLQAGDPRCRALWERFIKESLSHCDAVYGRLDVTLRRTDVMPESAYNDDLPHVIDDLHAQGLLTVSDGAQCVFLEQFKGKDGKPLPAIVRKSDGGYLYATTDLAAVRYRIRTLHANRILYFVDARQTLHLQQIFAIAKAAGFAPAECSLEHLPFGTMMGSDGRPFKTRTGGTVKLIDLLDESEERAYALVSEKSPQLPEAQRREIARAVGIGAVKYADLSKNRTSDYVFNWDTMLSFEGNTAPYLQYAYTRIRSIFRRGATEGEVTTTRIAVEETTERQVAVKLLQLEEVLQQVAAECYPNVLCGYLYDLAGAFMGFYENCPVLKAEPAVRESRLQLCRLTANTIRKGLDLLGIGTLEQM